jgi:hypothetical protein
MHDIEPHFRWRDQYIASEDSRAPFYGRKYSEFYFTNRLYNFYIHPQWDAFGSATLYGKLLYADYDAGFAMMELLGEWNDVLHNDIMFLKRNVLDPLAEAGISRFVFFCENLLNFHAGDDDYYAEMREELRETGGWVVLVNTRLHVEEEFLDAGLDRHLLLGAEYNELNWRPHKPQLVFAMIEGVVQGRIQRLEY